MGVTLTTAARNACCNAVVDLIDVSGPGSLQIATNSGFGTILATLPFSNPAFGSSSVGVAVANAITSDTNTGAGVAGAFRIRDGAGSMIMSGTVNTSGGDINFNSTTFTSGGTCSMTSLTVTQPAS